MKSARKIRPGGSGPGLRFSPVVIISGVCGLIALFLAYEFGQIRAGHNSLAALQRYGELENELEVSREENRGLRERIAILEIDEKIKAEAYRQVEDKLVELQTRILQQQEDLVFYRGIVSADQQAGLRIQNFELSPGPDAASYVLRLVLAQAIRNDRRVSGHVDVSVEGMRDGVPVSLGLAELIAEDGSEDRIKFSFRYFQNLQTDLTLPEGFAPDRVIVKLTPKGKAVKAVERTFEWPAAQATSG